MGPYRKSRMSVVRVRVWVPVLVAVSLLTFACASPPEAEKKAADEAARAARAAGAEQYAAGEFAAMTDALRKAESEVSAKAYKEAKASYVTAKELAAKAAMAAESGKAAMKAAVEKQLGDLDRRWQDLQDKVQAAAKKLSADQKKAWEADAKAVSDSLQAAKDATGADAAKAKDKLAAVAAALDKWEADLAALASPAKKPKS